MNRNRVGFTLVELLVVITIIGILMGLLIPAVNAARETARRNQCNTQLKNLALAAIQHENSKGQLPGYVQKFGLFAGGPDPSDPNNYAGAVPRHAKVGTWVVAILPWLDAQPTYEHWTEDRYPIMSDGAGDLAQTNDTLAGVGFHSFAAPNLAIMQCPSNPVSQGDFARNSYISNNGFVHDTDGPTGTPPLGQVSFAQSQDRDNGAFNSKYNVYPDSVGALEHQDEGPKVRLDDFKDGQGNTMLFSENVQALPWHRAGIINATDLGVAAAPATEVQFAWSDLREDARYIQGMVWHYEDTDYTNAALATFWNQLKTSAPPLSAAAPVPPVDVNSFHKINGGGLVVADDIFNRKIENVNDARDLARPSSAHVDGVNSGMADGGTRFIQESIDYRVYQALMTPRGKSSAVPWQEYILTDEVL